MDKLDTKLVDIDFGSMNNKCQKWFEELNLITVKDVVEYGIDNLLGIYGFGRKCHTTICCTLAELGLHYEGYWTKEKMEEIERSVHRNSPRIYEYKESGAIKNYHDGLVEYHGQRILYDDYQVLKFQHSLGNEKIKEDGELCKGKGCGFLDVQIYLNEYNPPQFELHISTESGEVISMYDLDVRILKKLNHFLTYALENTNER